jgi:endonuclease-3
MLALGEAGLLKFINTIGLHKTKAANLITTCALLLQRHHGQVPREREALEALPGVGRKTASVVLNTVFGEPTIAVDTHIFRVANRTGLAPGKTVLEVEKILLAVVPEEFKRNAHHWLVLHGRYVCTARRPLCASCIIRDLCQYPDKSKATSDAV